MRTQATLLGAALVLAAGCMLLAGSAGDARADEQGKQAPGVWIYDVRVVRVDPATKEGAEAPHPFAGMAGTTSKKPWREALGLLKQRGTTTILMDQNISTMAGEKATAQSDRSIPIMALNFANRNDEQKRSMTVKTGCRFQCTPGPDRVQYSLRAQWAFEGAKGESPPEQFVAEWNGSHPNLEDDTLVLHYREQVAQGKGAARAVEIYALVTGRLYTRR